MSIINEAICFLLNHKKLWLTPILIITILLLALLFFSEGTSVSRFSYAL